MSHHMDPEMLYWFALFFPVLGKPWVPPSLHHMGLTLPEDKRVENYFIYFMERVEGNGRVVSS